MLRERKCAPYMWVRMKGAEMADVEREGEAKARKIDVRRARGAFGLAAALGACAALAGASAVGCSGRGDGDGSASRLTGEPGEGLVISRVYGGGGMEGAPWTRDFVELFNTSENPVSLEGLSLQYAEADADFGAEGQPVIELPAVVLEPGTYFLVLSPPGEHGAGLSTDNAPKDFEAPELALDATSGKVALVRGVAPLACGGVKRCRSAAVVDRVGYGSATDYEGKSPVGALSHSTAAVRRFDGCLDHDTNADDFEVRAAVLPPKTSGSAAFDCRKVDLPPREDAGVEEEPVDEEDAGADAKPTPTGEGAGLVISQVHGGGEFDRPYVELFNATKSAITLDGLSLQAAGASDGFDARLGNGLRPVVTFPEGAEVAPGTYYLVAVGEPGLKGKPVPAPDHVGFLAIDGKGGKIALVRGSDPLACGGATARCGASEPSRGKVVDLVGYGSGVSDWEGAAPAPQFGASSAAFRKNWGCTDTDRNDEDFKAVLASPHNGRSPAIDCDGTLPDDPEGVTPVSNPGGEADAGKDPSGDGYTPKLPRGEGSDEDEYEQPLPPGAPRGSSDAGTGLPVESEANVSGCSTAPAPASGAGSALGAFVALGIAFGMRRRHPKA